MISPFALPFLPTLPRRRPWTYYNWFQMKAIYPLPKKHCQTIKILSRIVYVREIGRSGGRPMSVFGGQSAYSSLRRCNKGSRFGDVKGGLNLSEFLRFGGQGAMIKYGARFRHFFSKIPIQNLTFMFKFLLCCCILISHIVLKVSRTQIWYFCFSYVP